MRHTIAKLVIVITALCVPNQLYAQNPSAQESKPEGREMLVSGIVTTSVLSGAGALSALIGMFGGHSNFLLGGMGLIAVGTGAGIPMIVTGAKRYRAWKKFQASAQEEHRVGLTFSSLSDSAQGQYMQKKEELSKMRLKHSLTKPVALPLFAYEF